MDIVKPEVLFSLGEDGYAPCSPPPRSYTYEQTILEITSLSHVVHTFVYCFHYVQDSAIIDLLQCHVIKLTVHHIPSTAYHVEIRCNNTIAAMD